MKFKFRIPYSFLHEITNWRLWWTRAVVIAAAVIAGLTVVLFTWLSEKALTLFFGIQTQIWWAPLLWTPICTAAIVWTTRRYAPATAGSGIPQVMASLDSSVDSASRKLFVSLRISFAKIGLTAWSLLAGLSAGREGPSVQIAAGVMAFASRWLPKRSRISEHVLLVAGGAAGIAAAFNTPLAGVMFAIEELSRSPEQRNSGLIVTSIVLAGLMAQSIYGNLTYFGMIHISGIGLSLIIPWLLVALLSGLAGGLFSKLLIQSLDNQSFGRFNLLRTRNPIYFAAACGLVVAVIGVATNGATFGSGYLYTRDMLDGAQHVSAIYVLMKFVATWVTAWSGVPAGIFAPALAIGGALGNDVAQLTHYPYASTLIALGMAGFLAAVTQAPLTSFIIVMEMIDGHAMVLSLMACALIASMVSRLISKPLYASLALMQLRLLPSASSEFQVAQTQNNYSDSLK